MAVVVARRIVAGIWVLLVAMVGLDAPCLFQPRPDCAGPSPATATDAGAGAAAGALRWRMTVECGQAPDVAWSSVDDHDADEARVALRSTVFVAGDLIVVATPGSATVNGYDLATGERRWSRHLGAGTTVRWGGGTARWVWLWSSRRTDPYGRHELLDARTGALLWQRPLTTLDESHLEIAGEHLVLRLTDALVGLDPQTGQQRWRVSVLPGGWLGTGDRFAYLQDVVNASPAGQTGLIRVDLDTGAASILLMAEPVAGDLALVHPQGVLVFSARGAVTDPGLTTAVDAETGRVLWRRPGRPTADRTPGSVLLDDGPAATRPRTVLVDVRTGAVGWRTPPHAGTELGYRDGWLLVGERRRGGGVLAAVNADASVRWRSRPLAWPRETWTAGATVVVATCIRRYSYCLARQLVAVAAG